MSFDEVVNVHRNGMLFEFPTSAHCPVPTQLRFLCTNNMSKSEACITGLKTALDMNIKNLEVYKDSILIISQALEYSRSRTQN